MLRSSFTIPGALAALFVVLAGQTQAQCINGTKSYPIYQDGADIVHMLDSMEQEIVHIEYDLIFTSKEVRRVLSADWTYRILAFADDGVKDIDLKLFVWDDLLEDWTEVASESTSEPVALLEHTPAEGAEYKVQVTAYAFHEGYTAARYGLVFYHD